VVLLGTKQRSDDRETEAEGVHGVGRSKGHISKFIKGEVKIGERNGRRGGGPEMKLVKEKKTRKHRRIRGVTGRTTERGIRPLKTVNSEVISFRSLLNNKGIY